MEEDTEYAELEIISDLIQLLNNYSKAIAQDTNIDVSIKSVKLNIIIDTMKYLDNYKNKNKY